MSISQKKTFTFYDKHLYKLKGIFFYVNEIIIKNIVLLLYFALSTLKSLK